MNNTHTKFNDNIDNTMQVTVTSYILQLHPNVLEKQRQSLPDQKTDYNE